ncbi:MAG TPA: hypothetical protein VLJ58_12260 [Ramlibacter sp.]|nr:hypothetical protein [Ramlibacter sp.]
MSRAVPDADATETWLRRLSWWLLLPVLGPVWLVERDIWDGVIGTYGLERNDFSGIHDWLIPANWGLVYLMWRGLQVLVLHTGVPGWVWIKLLISISLLGIGRETRLLCEGPMGWPRRDARFAQCLALVFPCWYVLYGSTFSYVVFIWLGFMGHRLLHEGRGRAGPVAGYLLMLISFQVNSNFVLVCALEAIRWLMRPAARRVRWGLAVLVIGSAVLVYLALRLYWRPSGPFQNYNNLVWPFSREGLLAWMRAAAMALTWVPFLVLPGVVAWLLARGQAPVAQRDGPGPGKETLAVGLLLAGALFAYMAVGKGAALFVLRLPQGWLGTGTHLGLPSQDLFFTTADGWSMRNAFLLSVAASVASVWLVRLAVSRTSHGPRELLARSAAIAVALAVSLGFLLHGHAAKQLRLAQELAVVKGLQALPNPPPSGTVDMALAPAVGWAAWSYEANYVVWLAYGRTEWAAALYSGEGRAAAVAERDQAVSSSISRVHYLMDHLKVPGCHSELTFELPSGLHAASLTADRLRLAPVPAARLARQSQRCPSDN